MHQGARRDRQPRDIAPAARVTAAGILLDRGWGRAPQPHTGEGGSDIRIVIRQIIDGTDVDVGPSGATAKLAS